MAALSNAHHPKKPACTMHAAELQGRPTAGLTPTQWCQPQPLRAARLKGTGLERAPKQANPPRQQKLNNKPVHKCMERSIGASEAKSQLSQLLRAVEQGEQFTITVRGKPVAAAIAAMQALPRIRGLRDADVTSFVAEGRR